MFRTEEEKLVDTILGEAVIKLLDSNSVIGSSTLIAMLSLMAKKETDPTRQKACLDALNDVKNSLSVKKDSNLKQDTTASQIFIGQDFTENEKKH